MTTEVTGTENAAVIPEHWSREIIGALYDDNSLYSRVINKSQDLQKDGDKVHIPVAPTLTVQTVGSDGAVAAQAPTVTDVTLDLSDGTGIHEAILLEWKKSTKKQSFDEWWNALPAEAGKALKEQMESALLALGTGFTANTAVGDGSGHVDEDMVTAMIGTLVRAKLPILKMPDEHTFVFDGREFEYLKREGILDYNRTGQAGQGGAAMPGIPRIYTIPLFFSNQVQVSSSVNYNLLFHRTAMAAAVQQDIDLEYASGLANRKLTRLFSADVLYNVKEVVDARCVVGKTIDS